MVCFQSSSKASETGTNEDSNFKDDDDDDDNEEDEKVPPGSNIDPEKLKSFNVSHVTCGILGAREEYKSLIFLQVRL